MQEQNIHVTGGCRCGRLHMEITAAPLLTMACHCVGCQKMTASAFSLSVAIPTEGFRVTGEEPVIGGLRGATRHYFCPSCLSWVFTEPDGIDFFVNVRATMLADHAWTDPFIETCTSEKLDWATTPARYSYEMFPPFDAYEQLVAEFAAQSRSTG